MISGEKALAQPASGFHVTIALLNLLGAVGFAIAAYKHRRPARPAAAAIATLAVLGAIGVTVAILNKTIPLPVGKSGLQEGEGELATAATFGPVIERVVNDQWSKSGSNCIDFDSGRLLTLPAGRAADFQWVVSNGIDAFGDVKDARVMGLLATGGMVVVPVESGRWENSTPAEVRQIVMPLQSDARYMVAITATGELPATYVFKTREGGHGLLQITGFSDEPRAARLRYKLVQAE